MKEKINTYIAILLITIAGSGAALIIVHIATDDIITETFRGSEADYEALRKSIIENRY